METSRIKNEYCSYLLKEFELIKEDGNNSLFVTPYMYPDNDYIEIEIKFLSNGKIQISDNGNTLGFLFLSGVDINNNKFNSYLNYILKKFNIKSDGNEIFIIADKNKIGESIYGVIQGCINMANYIFNISHRTKNTYKNNFELFLIKSHIYYVKDFSFIGSKKHTVDYKIISNPQKNKYKFNKYIYTISTGNLSTFSKMVDSISLSFIELKTKDDTGKKIITIDEEVENIEKIKRNENIGTLESYADKIFFTPRKIFASPPPELITELVA